MRVFQHADLEIDPSRGEIRRLGAALPVESKVLDLVFLLIEAGGRTVDYAEIRERLWPGVHVSRDAVYRVVKEARALLGDDGRRQAVIRTLPGRGVRWVAPVEVREEAHAGIERPGLDAIQALYESGRISAAREQAMLLARLPDGSPESLQAPKRALVRLLKQHSPRRVVLVAHSECLYYDVIAAWKDDLDGVKARQESDLREARALIESWFPDARVETYYAMKRESRLAFNPLELEEEP